MKTIENLCVGLIVVCSAGLFNSGALGANPAPVAAPQVAPAATHGEEKKPAGKVLTLAEIEQIQKKLQSGKELTVDFTQTIYRSMRKKTSVRRGKGYFSKPDRFHWSLQSPQHEEWIYNGKFLAHFIPGKKSVYKYHPSAAKGKDLQHLIDMVLNFSTLFTQYQLLEATQNGSEVRLQLKPKAEGEIIQTEVVLEAGKNFIREIKLSLRGENYTLFQFSKPSTTHIAEKLFALPSGVKIEEVM